MSAPIQMLLWCPSCGARHIDEGEFATKAHHTHACQSCGMVWRPAIEPTCGVQFLPGFKNVDACTGITANWCPVHGDCSCPIEDLDDLDDRACPLHGTASTHGKEDPS